MKKRELITDRFLLVMVIFLGSLTMFGEVQAASQYHLYSEGIKRGMVRYVSQKTADASENGWGAYSPKGECEERKKMERIRPLTLQRELRSLI